MYEFLNKSYLQTNDSASTVLITSSYPNTELQSVVSLTIKCKPFAKLPSQKIMDLASSRQRWTFKFIIAHELTRKRNYVTLFQQTIIKMEHRPLNPDSDSAIKMSSIDLQMSQLQYKRPMGAYKPHFAGLPEDYYPSTWGQVGLCVLLVLLVMLVMLGLMVLFVLWDQKWGTNPFVLLWSVVILVFVSLLLVGMYFGGRVKIRNQRQILHDKLANLKRGGD